MQIALWLVAAVLVFAVAPSTFAENYPSKPIRLIIPFAPGGIDTLARVVAAAVSESVGQPVVVDNRPGAGGAIGAEITVRAPPDGYTLIMISSSYTASAAYRKLPYDPVNDIRPIVLVATMGLVMVVHPSFPAASIKELIAYAQANPKKLSYGSAGMGSINHLGLELFKLKTGTDMVHVPYKGAGPGLVAAVSGEIQLAPFGMLPALPHVKAGRLRAIAVTTPKRSGVLPDVPSVGETVPGFEVTDWMGIWAPKATPGAIVTRWNREVARVLEKNEIRARMTADGLEPSAGPPQQFRQVIDRDVAKWRRVVREAKIEPSN